ncbi:MAG: DUF5011 domain-containing protein [Erysipelotrichaceae bacterium]|nr:DUF5011 domain-containing protein [Erysipelotrichaceae bacterium]
MSFKKLLKVAFAALMVISLAACDTKPKEKTATFDKAGTFDSEEVLTSADIIADDVIIQNKTIEQDLYIKVPGNGSVTLDNVTVKGTIYVDDDNAATSNEYAINLFDVVSNSIEVEDVPVRLVASGDTNINMVKTDTDITLQEQSINKNGFNDVTIEDGDEVQVTLLAAGIRQLVVNDSAMTTVLTDSATMIEMLEANSPVGVHGGATINLLQANAPVITDSEPGSVVFGENGTLNGEGEVKVTTTTPVTSTTPVTTTKKPVTTTKKPVTTTTTRKPTTPVTTTTTPSTKANTAAVITAEDVTILIDSTFNPLKGVTIYDAEDGNITVTSANIKSNNVNVAKRGTYTVTYVYVDKGGLTTTLNRKVTVSNQLTTPQNLTAKLNEFGEIVLSWDPVDNAYTYGVSWGKTENDEDYTKKTTYTLDRDDFDDLYEDLFKTEDNLKFSVWAEHKYEDEVKESASAKVTFYNDELVNELEDIDTTLEVSKTPVKALVKLPAVGINSKKATVDVWFTNDEGNVVNDLNGEYITETVRTNKYGQAEFDYDVENGIEFELTFDVAANYDLQVRISDDNGELFSKTYEFEVVKKGSGTKRGTTKPELISWTADDSWGANDGAELRFSLTEDFDIYEGDSKIEVKLTAWSKVWYSDWIYYGDDGQPLDDDKQEEMNRHGSEEDRIYILEDDEVLGADYVEEDEEIVIYFNSSLKSSAIKSITNDYKDDCKISMFAEITVTDFEGVEKSIKTKTITFQKD